MLAQSMERRDISGGGIVLAGLVLTAIQFVQGFQQLEGFEGSTRIVVFAFETLPFVLVGLSLSFVGYWLSSQPEYEQDAPRIVLWGAGSTLLFASVAALILFSQQVKPTVDILGQAQYAVMNQITVGAVVGILLGLYDAQSRARQRDLERERDRIEQFAKKAADINNYGRELNRSDSIDQVSSLCIQSLQTFLGLTEIAFIITDEAESELVDNTVVNVSDGALVELARDSLDQEPASVTTHHSPPDELKERAENAITMLITDREDSSVVLLALTDDATAFDTEDIQLLEMLVSHASTALDRIYDAKLATHEETAT
jgi:hypothetical protein